MELADRIFVFCLEEDRGIMFYDQSPDGAVAKFSGSIPSGMFLSSGEEIVEWNPKLNGVKPTELDDDMAYSSEIVKFRDGEYTVKTFVVSEQTFADILKQIKNPEMVGHYKKIDFLRLSRNNYNNLNNSMKTKKINNMKTKK